MLASGRTKRTAWAASAVLGLATLAGVLAMAAFRTSVKIGLPLSAGVTLFVAASDLVPEVNREPGIKMAGGGFFGVGLLLFFVVFFLIRLKSLYIGKVVI